MPSLLAIFLLLVAARVFLLWLNFVIERFEWGPSDAANPRGSRLSEYRFLSLTGIEKGRRLRNAYPDGSDIRQSLPTASWEMSAREVALTILREVYDGGTFFPITNEAAGGFEPESPHHFRPRVKRWFSEISALALKARPNFALSPRFLQTIPGTDVVFRTAIRVSNDTFILPFIVPVQTTPHDIVKLIKTCEPSCSCSQAGTTKVMWVTMIRRAWSSELIVSELTRTPLLLVYPPAAWCATSPPSLARAT